MPSCVFAGGGDTFEPNLPPEHAIHVAAVCDYFSRCGEKSLTPPNLWDHTAGLPSDWNQSRTDPSEVDPGEGRILVLCFD